MTDPLRSQINTHLVLPIKYQFRICQRIGCWKHGDNITECWMPDHELDEEGWRLAEKPDFFYCFEHAAAEGFCKLCGEFWGGIESFEFEHAGYCDNCWESMNADFDHGEFDDADLVVESNRRIEASYHEAEQ